MKDNFEILFYLSAVLSIIGVLLLAYISPLINPPLKQIGACPTVGLFQFFDPLKI